MPRTLPLFENYGNSETFVITKPVGPIDNLEDRYSAVFYDNKNHTYPNRVEASKLIKKYSPGIDIDATHVEDEDFGAYMIPLSKEHAEILEENGSLELVIGDVTITIEMP